MCERDYFAQSSHPQSVNVCVYVRWASPLALIHPSRRRLLLRGLITSAPNLKQTQSSVPYIPHTDTADTHSEVTGSEAAVWTVMCQSCCVTWPNLFRVWRHFLVYGNKHECFIAFLWALANNNYPSVSASLRECERTACIVWNRLVADLSAEICFMLYNVYIGLTAWRRFNK